MQLSNYILYKKLYCNVKRKCKKENIIIHYSLFIIHYKFCNICVNSLSFA